MIQEVPKLRGLWKTYTLLSLADDWTRLALKLGSEVRVDDSQRQRAATQLLLKSAFIFENVDLVRYFSPLFRSSLLGVWHDTNKFRSFALFLRPQAKAKGKYKGPFKSAAICQLLWSQIYAPGKDGSNPGSNPVVPWFWKTTIPKGAILHAAAIVRADFFRY